jgi:hypothetical protein
MYGQTLRRTEVYEKRVLKADTFGTAHFRVLKDLIV